MSSLRILFRCLEHHNKVTKKLAEFNFTGFSDSDETSTAINLTPCFYLCCITTLRNLRTAMTCRNCATLSSETSKRRNEQNQFNVKHKSLLATETVRAVVTVTVYKSVRLSRSVHMNTMEYRGSVEKSYTYDSHPIFIAALTRN